MTYYVDAEVGDYAYFLLLFLKNEAVSRWVLLWILTVIDLRSLTNKRFYVDLRRFCVELLKVLDLGVKVLLVDGCGGCFLYFSNWIDGDDDLIECKGWEGKVNQF